MCSFKPVICSPVLILGAAVVGFVVWIAKEAQTSAPPQPAPCPQILHVAAPALAHERLFDALQLGHSRAMIEREFSVLSSPVHEPVDLSGDRPVCRVRYHIHLNRPVSQLEPAARNEFAPGPFIATLEYDAGVVGHPLIRVTVTADSARKSPLSAIALTCRCD